MTIFSNTSETEHLGNHKKLEMNHLSSSIPFHALCVLLFHVNNKGEQIRFVGLSGADTDGRE